MHIRIEMGTDIASIGLWDPGVEHPGKPAHARDYCEMQASLGQLFFIDTHADGSYPTDLYLDQSPDARRLKRYTTAPRTFLIESKTVQLIADGLEDFANPKPQITSADDRFGVAPGRYAIQPYTLDEDKYQSYLARKIGKEDLNYYSSQAGRGCVGGCLLFALALVMVAVSWVLGDLYPWLWIAPGALVFIDMVYISLRATGVAKDKRFKDIHQRIGEIEEAHVGLILVLTSLAADEQAEGGWHVLD